MDLDLDFSNQTPALATRLLSLLPTEVMKAEFEVKGAGPKARDAVVKGNQLADLIADTFRLLGHTRQHCYLFKHTEKNLAALKFEPFTSKICSHSEIITQTKTKIEAEFLLNLEYWFTLITNRTADKKSLQFPWPIRVIITPETLEIHMVIMERSMNSSENRIYNGRNLEDENVVSMILAAIPSARIDAPLDLNKGVKAMWDVDVIDAPSLAYKAQFSHEQSRMDGTSTYKAKYPDRYKEVVKDPLRKTQFRVIKDDLNYPPNFIVDPSQGFISFYKFPPNDSAIQDFMTALLALN